MLLPAHLTRLRRDACALGLPAPPVDLEGVDLPDSGLLRLTVTAHGTFFSLRPLVSLPPAARVLISDWAVHPQLQFFKTGNYAPYRAALAQATAAGADEALLRGPSGDFVDGSRSSPLLRVNGEYRIPAGGLPGVTRAAALAGLGVVARSVPFTPELLRGAEALWLCGSGVGVWPVGEVLDLGPMAPSPWPDVTPWTAVPAE